MPLVVNTPKKHADTANVKSDMILFNGVKIKCWLRCDLLD